METVYLVVSSTFENKWLTAELCLKYKLLNESNLYENRCAITFWIQYSEVSTGIWNYCEEPVPARAGSQVCTSPPFSLSL